MVIPHPAIDHHMADMLANRRIAVLASSGAPWQGDLLLDDLNAYREYALGTQIVEGDERLAGIITAVQMVREIADDMQSVVGDTSMTDEQKRVAIYELFMTAVDVSEVFDG